VVNITIGINDVTKSAKAHAFIATRDHFNHIMLRSDEKSFHLPPETQESVINFDLMAIAMRKDFQYKKQFNRLYANKK